MYYTLTQDIFDQTPPQVVKKDENSKPNDKEFHQSTHAKVDIKQSAAAGIKESIVKDNNTNNQQMIIDSKLGAASNTTLAQDLSYKDGFYSGDVLNNLPHGSGTFTS